MSLRARLLAGMAFIAAVLLGVAVVTTLTTRNHLVDQVDVRLRAFSPTHDADDDRLPPDGGGRPAGGPDERQERLSDVYQGFVDDGGVLATRYEPNVGGDTFSPPDVTADELPSSGSRTFTAESIDGSTTYRVLAQRFPSGTEITAVPIDDLQDTITRLVLVEVLGSLAILATLGLVSWWVVHLGIRPVKDMTATATRIAGGDLTVRVPETAPGTESGELAVALNQMLGRIEDALDERAASEDRLRRFVADASHELRTPVTTIRGYAELYRHGGLDDREALDDAMRRTEQEAARMGRLVEDMLTLANLDEGRPLVMRRLDLGALARDAGADAAAAAPGRPITVDVPAEPVPVDGDEDRLRQVIANVVGNALVHTEPEVPVTIRLSRRADLAVMDVVDEGAGMPAELAERVTERFFRVDPARSRHRGGSGLGLSIVADTATAHGGTIDVESSPGHGTTVRLTFPLAVAGHAAPAG